MQIRIICCFSCCLAMSIAGCGDNSNSLKLSPVIGVITLNGKPLSGTTVEFVPVGATLGSGATGFTDKAGKYELTAIRGGRGAPAGEYRVALERFAMPDGSDFPLDSKVSPLDAKANQVLPAKWNDREYGILKATVRDGENTIDFPLSSK